MRLARTRADAEVVVCARDDSAGETAFSMA
jgi:hypothetical protein